MQQTKDVPSIKKLSVTTEKTETGEFTFSVEFPEVDCLYDSKTSFKYENLALINGLSVAQQILTYKWTAGCTLVEAIKTYKQIGK